MDKILIIEDDEAIAELIQITLQAIGYVCEYALDGAHCVDYLERNSYDLILLDIMLPEINGYELLAYIKPLDVPVIFITAKGQLQDQIKGL